MLETTVTGYVGKDLELRHTPANKAVCDVSVGATVGYGEAKKTVWMKCTCWERNAENASRFLRKGSHVLFRGTPEYETYEKDGKTVVVPKITVTYMEFLGKASDGESASRQQQAPAHNNSYDDFDEFSSPIGQDDPF